MIVIFGVIFFGFNVTRVMDHLNDSKKQENYKEELLSIKQNFRAEYPEGYSIFLQSERHLDHNIKQDYMQKERDKPFHFSYKSYELLNKLYGSSIVEICEKMYGFSENCLLQKIDKKYWSQILEDNF